MWCCHHRITKRWHLEGKGLPAHSRPADLSIQHRFHTNQVIMGTVNPQFHISQGRLGRTASTPKVGKPRDIPSTPEIVALSPLSGRPSPAPRSWMPSLFHPIEPRGSLRPFCQIPQRSSHQPNTSCILVELLKLHKSVGEEHGGPAACPLLSPLFQEPANPFLGSRGAPGLL